MKSVGEFVFSPVSQGLNEKNSRMNIKNYLFLFLFLSGLTVTAQQPVLPEEDIESKNIIASLDSLTSWFHEKGIDRSKAGDLNYLNFEAYDVPSYSDSVYAYRLSSLESAIPLDYNKYVKGFIDLYAVRKRELTSKVLTLSSYYFPMFEQVLDEQDLPIEFKYLAVVESALNPRAVSCAGATGLWQFIHSTGLMYDLKINSYVDERRDPLKATYAACEYFKDSYRLYGDWLLVIASYNCGPGNVNKAIRKAGGGKKTFWEIQKYLPMETRGYVPAFIAATYVLNYSSEHNIFPMEMDINYMVDTVHIDKNLNFEKLSKHLGISIEELNHLNPLYKRGIVPSYASTMPVLLPYEKAMKFYEMRDIIMAPDTNSSTETIVVSNTVQEKPHFVQKKISYKVRRGDGLAEIADKYNCSVKEIKKWNNIRSNKIFAGQTLKIYTLSKSSNNDI